MRMASALRVSGFGLRVEGLGFWAWGLGFRAQNVPGWGFSM